MACPYRVPSPAQPPLGTERAPWHLRPRLRAVASAVSPPVETVLSAQAVLNLQGGLGGRGQR